MELLIETFTPDEANLIVESTNGSKDIRLSGILMRANTRNGNERIYPMEVLKISEKAINEAIGQTNGLLGELDHPPTAQINLERVSHIIETARIVDDTIVGTLKIIDTPMGRIASELIRNNIKIGVSSRAVGRVQEGVVQPEMFKFITVDIVSKPSTPGAYPDVISESLQQSIHGQEAYSLAKEIQHDPSAQKFFVKEFQKFLAEMNFSKK